MKQEIASHEFATPGECLERERSIANYWRVRIHAMLGRLENEARRMLQLETELSHFAAEYYEAVGAVSERLAEIEQKYAGDEATVAMAFTTPEMLASRDAREARRGELKTRYRTLAKELHPDRAMVTNNAGTKTNVMHALNSAYQKGDLAALLKLEAEMLLNDVLDEHLSNTTAVENALHELEKAADTYAESYRILLNSPLNELMLRAMSARLAGWDWMQAVVKKVERRIEEKERAAIEASIAQIGAWRQTVSAA